MSGKDWKEIWGRRSAPATNTTDLQRLINLDGFDSGAGKIDAVDWQANADLVSARLDLKDESSVFEFGCGAGAFLFALRQRHKLTVGGLDYSDALIVEARQAMPDGDFMCAEANSLDTGNAYDYVIANSLFHYFSRLYAAEVVARMIEKAHVAVAVLEIPDARTRLESEALRRDVLSQKAYDERYAGLEHTYYERQWFKEQAAVHHCVCEVFDGCVPNYAQNRFRFGAIFRKH